MGCKGNYPEQIDFLTLRLDYSAAEPAYDQLQRLYEKELDEPTEQEQFVQQATQKNTKKYA